MADLFGHIAKLTRQQLKLIAEQISPNKERVNELP